MDGGAATSSGSMLPDPSSSRLAGAVLLIFQVVAAVSGQWVTRFDASEADGTDLRLPEQIDFGAGFVYLRCTAGKGRFSFLLLSLFVISRFVLTDQSSPTFLRNRMHAEDLRLPVGAYHIARPLDSKGCEQADHLLTRRGHWRQYLVWRAERSRC